MADYVTSDQIAAFAHEFGALAATPSGVELLVTSASRLFDRLCEVPDGFFDVAASPAAYTSRDFFGDGTAYLKLDPYTALNPTTPVVIDPDFTYAVPTYTEKNGMLVVLERTKQQSSETAMYPYRFTGWRDGVKVTVSANWGFSAIPADVTLACVHLALRLWRTADPSFAAISNADDQTTQIETLPKIARDIIEGYREKYSRRSLFV